MPVDATQLRSNLTVVREEISAAARRAGRDPDEVTLVAAAKGVPPEVIGRAIGYGVTSVGHNYVQELRTARALVEGPVRWHYIGTLRTGTAHVVGDHADVVETVAGERAGRRLAGRAARSGKVVDVMLEVDFTGTRGGLDPADVAPMARVMADLDGVNLRGLMTIPPFADEPEDARPWFRALREIRDELREAHPGLLDLSMGMSLDYAIAVEEGATMVRIGTALFGARSP